MSGVYVPLQLKDIAKKVAEGQRPDATVRELISWFYGSQRRGRWVVGKIRDALNALNLRTEPDFDWTYLDGSVVFLAQEKKPAVSPGTPPIGIQVTAEDIVEMKDTASISVTAYFDPTYRIGRLEISHRPPVSLPPDSTINQAVTIMLKNDFSQLPVMIGEREVKGLFSWRSFGSACSQKRDCMFVREAMEDHCEVSINESIFQVAGLIKDYDCVLVRDTDKKIVGILTGFDISATFLQLAEPFLVLGEIENHVRNLMRGKFTKQELESARNPGDLSRTVDVVDDLTFGEYLRLLENPDHWNRLDLGIDRALFVKYLDEVRRIRNDVMHFDPDGIGTTDLGELRELVAFLRRLRKLRGNTGPNQ